MIFSELYFGAGYSNYLWSRMTGLQKQRERERERGWKREVSRFLHLVYHGAFTA